MSELAATPMRRGRVARYPTKLEVLARPELLRRHLPSAWLSRAELAAAAGAFLTVNLAGCSPGAATGQGAGRKATLKADAAAMVAPVFERGLGRGSTGCVIMNPPDFVSEEEAMRIVREELAARGLEMSDGGDPLEGVTIPSRHEWPAEEWITGSKGHTIVEWPSAGQKLVVDLKDAQRRVAVKFVSREAYHDLGGLAGSSTVSHYDFREVARYVATKAEEQGKGVYLGVFYDPAVQPPEPWARTEDRTLERPFPTQKEWKKAKKRAAVESRRLLREQVKDFADWLKAQGVI